MAKRITNAEIPTAARQNIPIAENPPIARNAPPIAEPTNPPMRLLAPIMPMAVARVRPGNVSAESAESHELGFWLYAYHGSRFLNMERCLVAVPSSAIDILLPIFCC